MPCTKPVLASLPGLIGLDRAASPTGPILAPPAAHQRPVLRFSGAITGQKVSMKRLLRPFWFVLAALFLFEAWIWDLCAGVAARLLAVLPVGALQGGGGGGRGQAAAMARAVRLRHPRPDPLPLQARGAVAHRHRPSAAGGGHVLSRQDSGGRQRRLPVRDLPAQADGTRMVRAVYASSSVRHWAHEQVEPFKARLRSAMATLRARLAPYLRTRGRLRRWRRALLARRRGATR